MAPPSGVARWRGLLAPRQLIFGTGAPKKEGLMKRGQRFVLTRAGMAIAQRDERNVAIMIPKGAIIEVIGGPLMVHA